MKFYIITGYPAITKYERMAFIMTRTNWEEEFTEVDREHIELLRKDRKEQLRKIAMQLILNLDKAEWLRSTVVFLAELQDMELKDSRDNYSLVKKGGVDND